MADAPGTAARIDLWIAGTMRPSTEIGPRLAAVGVTLAAAKEFAATARAAGLYQPEQLTAEVVTQFFGSPLSRTAQRLVYALTLWPEHVYEWDLDAAGRVIGSGFERRDNATQEAPVPRDHLRCWYHTATDVRRSLGEPEAAEGWWPEETLIYRGASDANEVEFTFGHRLLASIATPAVKAVG